MLRNTYTLRQNEKLKSKKLIEKLFREAERKYQHPLRLLYLAVDMDTTTKAGFTVSTKTFKKAVKRNRIKRLMREAYRHLKPALHNRLRRQNQQVALFFIYTHKTILPYRVIYSSMEGLLQALPFDAEEIRAGS